jgi:hypothetical protein
MAEFLFVRNQMPGAQIDELFQIWASHNQEPPYAGKNDLYGTIDRTEVGNVPWESFTVQFNGERGGVPAPWMDKEYEVWFRDPRAVLKLQLGNSSFAQEMDYAPKRMFDRKGKRYYRDFMSGNWAWRQAVNPPNMLSDFSLMLYRMYCHRPPRTTAQSSVL